ncbi:response regulator [Maribacter sp. X9]|uniref:response regulator n=1 Tax=Maribacter sp. X9 TaxID=3402159 RepID=UPI003AF35436
MSRQLLVVEDDPIFTFLLEKAITSANLKGDINKFSNGLTAIEYLKMEYHQHEKYIIFLDLNMSIMNGWQFMEILNGLANEDNCMVFVVTSSKNQSDLDILRENPMVADFITKPITEPIIQEIKVMIETRFDK